jgi:regulatory protein
MKPKSTPDPTSLHERALRLLARREHSRAELTRKLEQAGFDHDGIAPLLDAFEAKNWLSDRRFAGSYVADHLSKAGSIKLAFELRQRGVSDAVIDDVLRESRDSELERARKVWQKKFSSAPNDANEKARHIRFMQSRGFTTEVIQRVIGGGEN